MAKKNRSKRSNANESRSAVAYARVSTVEQAERDLSIPAQLEAIRGYAGLRGITIVREYIEPGASGTDDNRKVFRTMMEDLLSGAVSVDTVLVYHTSRFMRNSVKAQVYKENLAKHGVRVVAIQQETADDPSGHLMERMFEAFDQYESEVNGLRTAAAMRQNAQQGNWNGSHVPFGFRLERVEVAPGRPKTRAFPDPIEAPIVKELLHTYVGEAGAIKTAEAMNRAGLTHRGGKKWNKARVLAAISQTALIGVYAWGTRSEHNPDPIEIDVEPIVDRDLFDTVQRLRAERDPKKTTGRTTTSSLLLAGQVFCSKCGKPYQLQTSGKPSPQKPDGYRYYNCRSTLRGGKTACPGGAIPKDVLEQGVLEHMADRLFTEERCAKLYQDLMEHAGALRTRTDDQRRNLKDELKDVEARIERWETAFETGEMPMDLGMDRLRKLRHQREELRQALAKIVPLRKPPEDLFSQKNVRRFQKRIRDIFLSGDNAMTKSYLRFIVERIEIDGNEVRITAKPDAVAAMLSTGTDGSASTSPPEVRTTVVDWLQL